MRPPAAENRSRAGCRNCPVSGKVVQSAQAAPQDKEITVYLAWRELRSAKGRFTLIGAVVVLITLLVGFLSGLTGGLAEQNISGVLAAPADRLVFSSGGSSGPSFADSSISSATAARWAAASGVRSVEPLGVSQLAATHGSKKTAVAVFGTRSGYWVAPVASGQVVLSETAASDLGVKSGGSVEIAGTSFTVARTMPDLWYSHTPVVGLTIADWQAIESRTGGSAESATVLLVRGSPNWDAVASTTSTVADSPVQSLLALSAFRSEIGSLGLIIVMLFGISALVVGAFFTVWGMQRRADIAVLFALGASKRALLVDAIGQALVVLGIGVGIGTVLVVGFGAVAATALPFLFSPLTTLLPALVMVLVGVVGAAFALRPVLSADPLTALGSAR